MSRTPNRNYPYPDPVQPYLLTQDFAEFAKAVDTDVSGVSIATAPSVAVNDLTDVDTATSPAVDGQALVYSTADGLWKPGTMSVTNSGATELNGLSDVDTVTTAPLNAQVLGYDGTAARWVPVDIPAGVTTLDGLNDVVAESPAGGQVLTYNATTGQWEPAAAAGGTGSGATTLDELSDVSVSASTPGQVLTRDSNGNWVGVTPSTGTAAPTESVTVGSTTGLDSGSTYTAATTNLDVRKAMTLTGLSFHAITAATYTLSIGGVAVGTVTHSGATAGTASFTGLDVHLPVGNHTVSVGSSAAARVRYANTSSIVHTGSNYDFTVSGWVEPGGAYTLPFTYEATVSGTTSAVMNLNDLTDVDTATSAPAIGQTLTWDGTNWVPTTTSPGGTVSGILVIDKGATVSADTAEGTIIYERTV